VEADFLVTTNETEDADGYDKREGLTVNIARIMMTRNDDGRLKRIDGWE